MSKKQTIEEQLKQLPDVPGIYLYYDTNKKLVYVGKATSLMSRVKSYFRGLRSPRPIEEMIHEVETIKWITTDSVLEAVVLEAIYIKKFLPKYNVLGKDNKSWNYIVITKDTFPKVLTIRQHEYAALQASKQSRQGKHVKLGLNKVALKNIGKIFGPYPGLNTKGALKLLRQLFRFTNCEPPAEQRMANPTQPPLGKGRGRPCLYYQMGQCIGVCAGDISAREYKAQVIRPLTTFLSGKKKQVVAMLEKDMKRFGKEENFEAAARIRDQLASLYHIQDIALLNKSFVMDLLPEHQVALAKEKAKPLAEHPNEEIMGGRSLRPPRLPEEWSEAHPLPPVPLSGRGGQRLRIEGYDISNTGATEKVGSMVVVGDYGPVKDQYRKFIIRGVAGQSDVDSMAEMINRRLNHLEWPLPNAFLIDGGRPQVNKVVGVLAQRKVAVPVVGIAKGPERKRNDFILGNTNPDFIRWVHEHQDKLIQARDEAHRFAITFHRKRRGKRFLMV